MNEEIIIDVEYEEVLTRKIVNDNKCEPTEPKKKTKEAPPESKSGLEKFSDSLQKHWFVSFVALIMLIIILHKLNVI